MSLRHLRFLRRIFGHVGPQLGLCTWQALTAPLEAINKFSIPNSIGTKGSEAYAALVAVAFDFRDEIVHGSA